MTVNPRYQNIVNRINIFQLIGDASRPEATMHENIERILQFYRVALGGRNSAYYDELAELIEKFYWVSCFYHVRGNHHEFIVHDFSVIRNDEWLTIVQFMAFLKIIMRDNTLSSVFRHIAMEIFNDSRQLRRTYYFRYTHTTVSQQKFRQVIHSDFD